MTREELRDYVDEQRTLNNIPYHVYSTLIDGIDTLEQEPVYFPPCVNCNTKMNEIRETYDKLKNQALEQEPILDKIRAEIKALPIAFTSSMEMKQDCLRIVDKYKERK